MLFQLSQKWAWCVSLWMTLPYIQIKLEEVKVSKTVEFLAPYSLINNDKAHLEFSKETLFSPGRTSLRIIGSDTNLSDTPRLPQTLGKMTLWFSGLTIELYCWHKEGPYGICHFSLHRIRTRGEMSITCYSHSALKRGSILYQQNLGPFAEI